MTVSGLAILLVIFLFVFVLGLVVLGFFDAEGLGEFLASIGAAFSIIFLVLFLSFMAKRWSLSHYGPSYQELNEDIIIISSYNIKDKSDTPLIYTELINKIEKYNQKIDNLHEDYRFVQLDEPEELNTYTKMYYDYENNVAKWETGGIVTW